MSRKILLLIAILMVSSLKLSSAQAGAILFREGSVLPAEIQTQINKDISASIGQLAKRSPEELSTSMQNDSKDGSGFPITYRTVIKLLGDEHRGRAATFYIVVLSKRYSVDTKHFEILCVSGLQDSFYTTKQFEHELICE